MSKIAKLSAAILLALLATMALTTMMTTFAQDEEPPQEQFPPRPPVTLPPVDEPTSFVIIASAVGGTTDPEPGQYEYPTSDPNNPATYFSLTAIPFQGYRFLYWVISGDYTPGHNLPPVIVPDPIPEDYIPPLPDPRTANWDSLITSQNPLNVICGYGYTYTYQPVFTPTSTAGPGPNQTTVVLLSALGGTSKVIADGVSHSAPGTYTFATVQDLSIEAIADEGYAFAYWIAEGEIDTVLVNSQEDIVCQEGYTYTYQPVFTPHGAPATEQGIPDIYFYVAIIVLVIIAIIGLGVALMYRSRSHK